MGTGPDKVSACSSAAHLSGSGDPHVCARCAMKGTTCCHVDPGNEEFCFPLSRSEQERIIAHCRDESGFADEPNTQSFLDTMRRLFPLQDARVRALFPVRGVHVRLASDAEGYCIFLTEQGCRLPREVRPWFCLLFPFWVRGEMLTMFTAMGCLVCRETDTVDESLELLGITTQDVRSVFENLRHAWGLAPDEEL